MSPDDVVKWLEETARFFERRPTCGEDKAYWANRANAENCRKIALLIQRQDDAIEGASALLSAPALTRDHGETE